MKTAIFDYDLPKKLIAQKPADPRDHSRLMLIDRKTGKITHHHFYDLPKFLSKNDVLVFNKTKVFPARIFAVKDTGGKIEALLLEEVQNGVWEALTKPGIRKGQKFDLKGNIFECIGHKDKTTLLRTKLSQQELLQLLKTSGHTPLPPYISSKESERSLRKKYQTVYAQKTGSVAAPTAGFHFTNELLYKLKSKGVQMEYVTLHVGLGTFLPVKTDNIEMHQMHHEHFEVDETTLNSLNVAKEKGERIIAVGTTTTRVLETLANKKGLLNIDKKLSSTNLFIYPPYKFRFVDGMITNFHLPKSTLIMMISAFTSYPNIRSHFKTFEENHIGKAYSEALKRSYRFYSFGDASLIV